MLRNEPETIKNGMLGWAFKYSFRCCKSGKNPWFLDMSNSRINCISWTYIPSCSDGLYPKQSAAKKGFVKSCKHFLLLELKCWVILPWVRFDIWPTLVMCSRFLSNYFLFGWLLFSICRGNNDTQRKHTCLLLWHKSHLAQSQNILLLLAIQCSIFDIQNAQPKFANFTITALNVKIAIKLTISDVSNNKSILETCISSEPESLSSSKCCKKHNNKKVNITSKD